MEGPAWRGVLSCHRYQLRFLVFLAFFAPGQKAAESLPACVAFLVFLFLVFFVSVPKAAELLTPSAVACECLIGIHDKGDPLRQKNHEEEYSADRQEKNPDSAGRVLWEARLTQYRSVF